MHAFGMIMHCGVISATFTVYNYIGKIECLSNHNIYFIVLKFFFLKTVYYSK